MPNLFFASLKKTFTHSTNFNYEHLLQQNSIQNLEPDSVSENVLTLSLSTLFAVPISDCQ
ncbi:unnamed protein product [Leptidea sinapis]|uniref:Uncharacterized protein n=1 Tax=Leptidea sinapis TaxID=189913 RepID=A0A5E4QUG4_9NEOP|nr:unnamed protein product [Leptidea sinapis]